MTSETFRGVLRLISELKKEELNNSNNLALATLAVMEKMVSEAKWKNASELMDMVREAMRLVEERAPKFHKMAINMMRHILKIIREEYRSDQETRVTDTLERYIVKDVEDYTKIIDDLKSKLLTHLNEYKTEVITTVDNIAAQSLEQIQNKEIILTVGRSVAVEHFLMHAAEKGREFEVIVVEGGPKYKGRDLAQNLAARHIKCTIIVDAAIYAVMSRVNKVVIGTHLIMSDGGLCAPAGTVSLGIAAKQYAVPVIVLAPMYKITPMYLTPHEMVPPFEAYGPPSEILPPSMDDLLDDVIVINPLFDYVEPEYISLHIGPQGGYAPSYVCRVLSELYHPDDCE